MICHRCGTISPEGIRYCAQCGAAFPPPLPGVVDPTVGLRSALAGVLGALAYFAALHRFLSYSERNRLGGSAYLMFALLVFAVGFAVTLMVTKSRYRIASWILVGACALHAVAIAVDLREDPTNHNLLPFEFVILCLTAIPAYLGAAISVVASRYIRGS